jgi:N utilization substance protein B
VSGGLRSGSRWEGRRRSREAALRMLYQLEVGQLSIGEVVRTYESIGEAEALTLDPESQAYAAGLVKETWAAREAIDEYIADAAQNWRLERIAIVDRMVMRLAIHELLAPATVPPRVAIDEAIELARRYSGDEAARFVNGVLDGVFRRLKEEGKTHE